MSRSFNLLWSIGFLLVVALLPVKAQNILTNGGFEAGKSGFLSDYLLANDLHDAGTYTPGYDPVLYHSEGASYKDHTSGTGQMLIVNGSDIAGKTVWAQTVTVSKNHTYEFSGWAASWGKGANDRDPSPANLRFFINDVAIGTEFTLNAINGLWTRFSATWYSGQSTSATIKIVDLNLIQIGNDFTLDDLAFLDLTPTSTIDVNSDGNPDLLWQNSASPSDISYWLMNGTQRTTYGYYALGIPSEWRIVGTPQVDTDGKHDLLWQNRTTGEVVYWRMNGTQQLSYGSVAKGVPSEWEVVATPDLNRDGKFDLLWRNRLTGAVSYWLMNGITRTSYGSLLLSSDTNWQIVATLDLNGDGNTDLLWQNVATGDVVWWRMNGVTMLSYATLASRVPLQWKIAGRIDFNQDGKMDLLWRNQTTGDVVYWLMNGTTQISYGTIATSVPLTWQIAGMR